MGWNFFLNMYASCFYEGTQADYNKRALLVPFEIVALSLMIGYWTDAVPAAAVVVIMMVIYM